MESLGKSALRDRPATRLIDEAPNRNGAGTAMATPRTPDTYLEVTFGLTGDRYVFASADKKILIAHPDRDAAAALFIRLFTELARKGTLCRIEAYAPLGPALKLLRDAGAICRVGLEGSPSSVAERMTEPSHEPTYWRNRGASSVEERSVPPPVFQSWTDYLARTTEKERMAWCSEKAKRASRRDRPPDSTWLEELPRIKCHLNMCNSPHGWCAKASKCDPSSSKSMYANRAIELIGQTPMAERQKRFGDTMRYIFGYPDKNHPLRPTPKITKHQVWAVMSAALGRCAYCNSLAVERAPANPVTKKLAPWAQIGRRIGSLDHVASPENHPDNLAWCCLWCNTWPQERRPQATDHGGY